MQEYGDHGTGVFRSAMLMTIPPAGPARNSVQKVFTALGSCGKIRSYITVPASERLPTKVPNKLAKDTYIEGDVKVIAPETNVLGPTPVGAWVTGE